MDPLPKTMPAVGYEKPGPIDRAGALVDLTLPVPEATGRDLLVEVKAVSVNPVDTKVRAAVAPEPGPRILGWDAAGVVVAVGPDATRFAVGDAVYYAGALERPGTNERYHLVDERIVGSKPRSLDFAQAAALPLTSITAWESLFDRLDVMRPNAPSRVLLVIGTGGVGSMAIALARIRTDLTIVATASQPESVARAREMGAHHVIDHRKPLDEQMQGLALDAPAFVFSTTASDEHITEIVKLIAPQGHFALIDDPERFDVVAFKNKSISIHWELMFTRSMFTTTDMSEQGRLLDEIASFVDAGKIKTTLGKRLSPIDAKTMMEAHALVEHGTTGKVVVEGFAPGDGHAPAAS